MIKAKPKICDRILALFMAFAMLIVVLSDNMLRTYAAPADAFTITVADKSDNAISGATVAYEVTVDGASFTQRTVETGDDGRVEISEIADIDFTAQPTPVVKLSATITKADYKQSVLTDTAVTSTTGNVNVTLKEKAVDADFGFANPNPVINYDQNNTGFTNPLTKGNGNGNITFEIEGGKSDVASIDATNGELTINKTGTVTVTAKKAADENYKAAQASYTLTVKDVIKFDKETPELDFDPEKENTYTQEVTIGASLGVVKYKIEESTPSDAASIDESSGKVTITKPGKIKVGADLTIGEGGNPGKTFSASYILTVNKADQTGFAFEKQNPGAITYDPKNNTFSNKASSDQGEDNVTYEITSDNGVASIDSTTGILTILKAGDVTVKATRAADDKYNEVTAKYTLTINKADQTNFAFEKPNPEAVTYDPKNNTFSNKASSDQGADNVTYTITSDNGVASIDINGTLTILKAGTVTVKATRAADDKYKEATAEYTLTINKADQTNFAFEKPNPGAITYKPGLTFENAVTGGQSAGNITYTITSGKDVASIDDSNGTLTINKAGTVTVKATRAADDKYKEATAEYTLTIDKANQTGFVFEKTQHEITYEPDLTFDNAATGGQSTGNVTYMITSGNDVASIDSATGTLTILKAGTVTVKAVRAGDDCYNDSYEISYTLKINKADQTGFEFEQYDNDTYKITYNTGMSFKNAVSGGQGTGNITYSLSSDIVSIDNDGNITFKNGQVGTVTVTATRAADDKYNEVSTKYTLNISYLVTPENSYVLSGAKLDNNSKWYTGDITITPADGYKISWSNKLSNNEWSDYLTVSTEGNENAKTVYLKNDEGITAGIDIGDEKLMIDRTAPAVSVKYDNNSADSDKYFDKNRTATITITEHNFDPAKVEAIVTVNGTVSDKFNADLKKAESWKSEGDVHTAKITFSDNADYTFSINCTDKAGHVTENNSVTFAEGSVATGEFTVDKTAPKIEVAYDNNSVKNGKYFKADRTATITITEHNFDVSRVKAVITDKNATDTVSDYAAYLSDLKNWTADGDKHTATITFSVDADYTFSISCTDKAGNANKAVNYGESEVPEKFTVDKTNPENLVISYSESVLDIVLQSGYNGYC